MEKIPLAHLKKYFKSYKYTDEPIKIYEGTVVENQKLFVASMIKLLDANTGNINYEPYYNHLVAFYKKVKKDENKDDQKNNNSKN